MNFLFVKYRNADYSGPIGPVQELLSMQPLAKPTIKLNHASISRLKEEVGAACANRRHWIIKTSWCARMNEKADSFRSRPVDARVGPRQGPGSAA
jgi:hypothetical protein